MEGNDRYIGRILDNRYEILELIGAGGMALVYKARCHRLNRLVAVKILKEDLAGDQEFQRRFYSESQAVAMLSHPNIVAVYDVSRSGTVEYIVMELIEGITLKQYMNRKGLLNWKEALHFSTQITRALCHAHSRGIIHRDIKPHNIMILKDGSVKVADFGIARLLNVDNTMTQEALGSVHYISPEQAKGGQIDERSDIYSLGVVMYEMLTSRLPFVGDSAVSVAIQHISAIPLMPREINPEVPLGLEDITMHAMEPDVNMRFNTADEMLYSLEEFRKNPAIYFGFARSEPSVRHTDQYGGYDNYNNYDNYDNRTHPAPPSPYARDRDIAPPQRPEYKNQKPLKKPEMTRDEHRKAKKRSRNTATLVGIFAAVLFLVVLGWFAWGIVGEWFGDSGETITIPDFVGQRAERILNDEQYEDLFNFNIIEEHDEEIPEGIVISQSPPADREVTKPLAGGIRINLVVSIGREPALEMPDLVGSHFSDARNRLNRLGLDLDIVLTEVPSDEVDRDIVISTRPAFGEQLDRGDTVVITYSGGPDIRTEIVPDFVGRHISLLLSAFDDLEMMANIQEMADDAPEGTVLWIQSVGQEIVVPATLRVNVSSGPAERTVEVPNMIGSTQSALEARFATLELTPIITSRPDSAPAGTVLEIEHLGQRVTVPVSINVVVSSGPPQEPPPQPHDPDDD